MSLTVANGPLAAEPATHNYQIDGPEHRVFFHPLGRRIRLEFAGSTIVDTRSAALLHETGIRPRLYVPLKDARTDFLTPTDTTSFCPYKGHATYRTVAVGDEQAEDALWLYENPVEQAPWLRGYAGVYEERFDRILDEEDDVRGHVPDPFHRIDIRRASSRVRVTTPDGTPLAETERALLLAETGLPNRYYIPTDDVLVALTRSDTVTVCPYKGTASYWTADGLPDAAWSYESPLDESRAIAGMMSFSDDTVVAVDHRATA
ncbi:DUF427 domain-containing protein [Flindersiella endophytica]